MEQGSDSLIRSFVGSSRAALGLETEIVKCEFCGRGFGGSSITKHRRNCGENPGKNDKQKFDGNSHYTRGTPSEGESQDVIIAKIRGDLIDDKDKVKLQLH